MKADRTDKDDVALVAELLARLQEAASNAEARATAAASHAASAGTNAAEAKKTATDAETAWTRAAGELGTVAQQLLDADRLLRHATTLQASVGEESAAALSHIRTAAKQTSEQLAGVQEHAAQQLDARAEQAQTHLDDAATLVTTQVDEAVGDATARLETAVAQTDATLKGLTSGAASALADVGASMEQARAHLADTVAEARQALDTDSAGARARLTEVTEVEVGGAISRLEAAAARADAGLDRLQSGAASALADVGASVEQARGHLGTTIADTRQALDADVADARARLGKAAKVEVGGAIARLEAAVVQTDADLELLESGAASTLAALSGGLEQAREHLGTAVSDARRALDSDAADARARLADSAEVEVSGAIARLMAAVLRADTDLELLESGAASTLAALSGSLEQAREHLGTAVSDTRQVLDSDAADARARLGEAAAQALQSLRADADAVQKRLDEATVAAGTAIARIGQMVDDAALTAEGHVQSLATAAGQAQTLARAADERLRRAETVTEKAAQLATDLNGHESRFYRGVNEARAVADSASEAVARFRTEVAEQVRRTEGLKRQVEARSAEVVQLNAGMNEAVTTAQTASARTVALEIEIGRYKKEVAGYSTRVASYETAANKASEKRTRHILEAIIGAAFVVVLSCAVLFVTVRSANSDARQAEAQVESLSQRLRVLETVPPTAQPVPAPAAAPADTSRGRVTLLTSAGTPGLATSAAAALETSGFAVLGVGSTGETRPTTVYYGEQAESRAVALAEALGTDAFPVDDLQFDWASPAPPPGTDIVLVIGSDWSDPVRWETVRVPL